MALCIIYLSIFGQFLGLDMGYGLNLVSVFYAFLLDFYVE
jgi:hypothetical protein